MLSVGVLGINFKTADLILREAIARSAQSLRGERALFFRHPIVLLSTCNRTEIYFSADHLGEAHSDLLAHLRTQMDEPFEHRLYSYFGIDCFAHLCRVAAGLDSAILGETEIQRQVKVAYANGRFLPSSLHYVFQKALKVSKLVRREFEWGASTLYGVLWQMAEWKSRRILLVGYSEINRGLISFLTHKGIQEFSLCTRDPTLVQLKGIDVCDRGVLKQWQEYDVIVCASKADGYLISGRGNGNSIIFDLSVPRNVDPEVGAQLYNIDQLVEQKRMTPRIERYEALIWENVAKLARFYRLKTQHGLESVGTGSHL